MAVVLPLRYNHDFTTTSRVEEEEQQPSCRSSNHDNVDNNDDESSTTSSSSSSATTSNELPSIHYTDADEPQQQQQQEQHKGEELEIDIDLNDDDEDESSTTSSYVLVYHHDCVVVNNDDTMIKAATSNNELDQTTTSTSVMEDIVPATVDDDDDDDTPVLTTTSTIPLVSNTDNDFPLFTSTAIPATTLPFGGLYNLGNTCYMASAIQMIASLDCFTTDIKDRIPPLTNTNGDESATNSDNCNRDDTMNSENSSNGNDDIDETNSSLQSQADEDDEVLPQTQHEQQEAEPTTPTLQKQQQPSSLREALLDILEKLNHGETISPTQFKRCIDDRTSLFVGYHQQDSHEFLTTLLDMIDEEYKMKKKEDYAKEEAAAEEEVEDANKNDDDDDDVSNKMKDDEEIANKKNDDEEMADAERQQILLEDIYGDGATDFVNSPQESSPKKPRLDDASEESAVVVEVGEDSDVRRRPSLINFQFEDIENLLHGENDASNTTDSSNLISSSMDEEPKCKLVGGRMNTTQTELTRYVPHSDGDCDMEAVDNTDQDSLSKFQDDSNEAEEESTVVQSPVESNFTTEVRVCLTCESCKYRRRHTETYLHLSLEIGSSSTTSSCYATVEDGIRKFFASEKREIKCEKCFHNSAVQTMEITKLPRVLLLHLKRFIVDVSPDYTSISYRKDQSPVSFEEKMTLESDLDGVFEEFLAPDVLITKGSSYAIRSIVNHIGASASCGHYTADAKRVYHNDDDNKNHQEREWTRFNDSYVTKISSQDALENSSRTAYMIMYELED